MKIDLTGAKTGDKISKFIELHGIKHQCTTSGDLAVFAIAKMFDIDIRSDHEKALDWMAEYKATPKMMLSDIKDGKCPWLKWVGE